jgi:FkbM family methyltransferase
MDNKILFFQLKPWMAFKMLCFRAINKLLNPYANIFFGFTAEDQVINMLLGFPIKEGFYVDVGCNHPIRFSNTFNFYQKGWKGLTIDANPKFIELQRKIRPKDISISCAVSNSEREVVFTNFSDPLYSSISPEFVEKYKDIGPIISEVHLKTRTLDSVLIEHNIPNEFDFLSIDVEGHDFEVLSSITLIKYRPKLIIIEMRELPENLRSNPIYPHLERNGYKLVAYYPLNGFFMREELFTNE